MRINVGSKNKTKVEAVEEVLKSSPLFKSAEIVGVEVKVEEFGQPKNLNAVIEGAIDRAKQAFVGADYGVGIESGLMEAPHTKTGFVETTACAIYDGKQNHIGFSPAFEWPKSMMDLILGKGMDASQAMKAAGLTQHEKIGTAQGGVSILSNGRINRKTLNILATTMALIHLEHPKHY